VRTLGRAGRGIGSAHHRSKRLGAWRALIAQAHSEPLLGPCEAQAHSEPLLGPCEAQAHSEPLLGPCEAQASAHRKTPRL
jgi:hypothetical protein